MQPDDTSRPTLPPGRLSASRLELADKCPGSFSIGHVQTESAPAWKGTRIHAFIEKLLVDGVVDLDDVSDPEARWVCERLDADAILRTVMGDDPEDPALAGPFELLVEQAFALSPDATDALALPRADGARGEARDYSAAPEGYVCGTADAVALTDEAVVVTDWKTGGAVVTSPENNLQLRFHALAAALAYGVERAVVQVAYISPEADIHGSSCVYEQHHLEEIAAELRGLVAAVEKGREGDLAFRAGAHCRHCPAFARCPAQAGAAQALLNEDLDEIDPARVPEIWRNLLAVEAATKRVRRTLTDYLANRGEGVSLAEPGDPHDTAELRLVETRRETILPEVAMPLLRELYGVAADGAVTVTKKGLQKVAGGEARTVLSALEEREAIKTTHSESLREYGNR